MVLPPERPPSPPSPSCAVQSLPCVPVEGGIGVAAPGFKGVEVGRVTDVFVPVMMKAQMTPTWPDLENRRVIWLLIFGG